MRIFKQVALAIIGLVAGVLLIGWIYQTLTEARDNRRFSPPGKLVNVDGHRMHIYCQGQGSPTVIIDVGIGAQSLAWVPITQRMAAVTTVCLYDRVGMGYSDPVNHLTRAPEIASNLHKLLQGAGITGDIVLLGWSAGGLYVREYYRQFPSHVKGMVLVDSSHEQQFKLMPNPDDSKPNPLQWSEYLAPLGWYRITGQVEKNFAQAQFPPNIRDRLIAINLKSHMPRTVVAEGDSLYVDLAAQRAPPGLGNIPLVVISEGKPNVPFMQAHLQTWYELQDGLADLSTNGEHVVATRSAHAIHRTEPELIINAVQKVVSAARHSGA